MADQDTKVVEAPSSLGMSDEEFMKMAPPSAEAAAEVAESTEVVADVVDSADATDEADVVEVNPAKEDTDSEEDDSPTKEEVADAGVKAKKDEKSTDAVDDPAKDPAEKQEVADKVDFEAEYKKLLTPFKANGRDIAVNNVDDAIALMQMGANYNKKMAALKPNLKLMKLLDNNGLLTEEKISFLIDLEKKNPDAINKLVKDSGINPMDIDADKAGEYKQSTYTVDDREMELDTVLDDIQSTPTYTRTLDVVSTKWDGASKKVIADQPQILKVINDHMQRGIYDIISKEVESERIFGRLNGLSDIEAYRKVGDSIQAKGGFNHLNQGSSPVQGQPQPQPVIVVPKPVKVVDDKLNDKRRAASSTKPVAPSVKSQDFNVLGMSDEEFSKQVNNKFL